MRADRVEITRFLGRFSAQNLQSADQETFGLVSSSNYWFSYSMTVSVRALDLPADANQVQCLMDDSDLCNSPELLKCLASGDAFSLVADTDGIVLGWLVVHTNFRPEYGWVVDADTVRLQSDGNAYLEIISVAIDSRNSGVGTQLIRAAEHKAKSLGKLNLWLHVRDDNAGAIRFYEREQWTYEYSVTPDWRDGQRMRVYSKSLI